MNAKGRVNFVSRASPRPEFRHATQKRDKWFIRHGNYSRGIIHSGPSFLPRSRPIICASAYARSARGSSFCRSGNAGPLPERFRHPGGWISTWKCNTSVRKTYVNKTCINNLPLHPCVSAIRTCRVITYTEHFSPRVASFIQENCLWRRSKIEEERGTERNVHLEERKPGACIQSVSGIAQFLSNYE